MSRHHLQQPCIFRGFHHKFLKSFEFRVSRVWGESQDDGLAGGEEGPGLLQPLQSKLPVCHRPGADTVNRNVNIYTKLQQIYQ